MAATLKKLVGEGGAGISDEMGFNNLYDVLKALAETQNALVAAFNVLLTEYNAETDADHTTSAASAVTAAVTVE